MHLGVANTMASVRELVYSEVESKSQEDDQKMQCLQSILHQAVQSTTNERPAGIQDIESQVSQGRTRKVLNHHLHVREKMQNYLAREGIRWQFKLARSPWWGGFYERLIKEIKKTLHKTLGRLRLSYEAMESVVMDIERNLNNRPLTYVEAEGEEEVLTPNVIIWGRDAYPIEDIELIEDDKEKLMKMNKRLEEAKAHARRRWKRGYIHSLMEGHRLNQEEGATPVVGEVALVVGDETNRGEWKKGKVSRLIQGKDGVVRGVILLHKGHNIERPLQLVCPLEIRVVDHSVHLQEGRRDDVQPRNQ
ncbi:uncharacterized protein [Montipora foliosa]|uniref:uncharacterized protein n=1 Tax=Montipora foliosa TaxID=591990 RepID=UPI0035F12B98